MRKEKEKVENQKVQKQEEKNKIGIKDKIKRFLKNKKAVAMLMEYIITIECFAMLFLLVAPEEVKAAVSIADENEIRWAYTLSNGKASNVYYESGPLGETVTIPATISDGTNEYPVVSLYNSSGNSRNIFTKRSYGSNTTVKKVIIPEGVTSIGYYAFEGCSSLSSVEISSSVTSIGARAFSNCSSLSSVVIPEGVASIGENAFYGCSSLSSVVIPEGVTSIGARAFSNCSSLTSLTVDANNSNYSSEDDILYNKDKTILIQCAGGKKGEFNIPDSVTSIGARAFSNCSSLSSVVIPEGVTSIGENAFSACSSLSSVEIPSSVMSIGAKAFFWCRSLSSVVIPEGVTRIGENAFYGCSSLSSVVIPEGVTSIGENAFYACSSLSSVEIPSSVTSIGARAFYGCSSLSSVVIPEGVTSIGENAFYGCSSLSSVEIPSSVTSIGARAFSSCSSLSSLTVDENNPNYSNEDDILYNKDKTKLIQCAGGKEGEFNIPEGVTSIGENAFYGCSSLSSVDIPSSVISIGSSAFAYCKSMEDIYISNLQSNVTFRNGWYNSTPATVHYSNCTHTIRKNIQEGLTIQVIQENQTDGNYKCKSIYKFKVLNSLGEVCINKKIMYGDNELKPDEEGIYTINNIIRNKTLTVGAINKFDYTFTDENGITWRYTYQDGKATNIYPNNRSEMMGNIEIPEQMDGYEITSIAKSAFSGCSNLTKINIPNNVNEIKYNTFLNCENLVTVGSLSNIQLIHSGAFFGCEKLNINLQNFDNLVFIGDKAFKGCINLNGEIRFTDKLRYIGVGAFEGCSGIDGKLEISSPELQISNRAFYGTGINEISIQNSLENDTSSNHSYRKMTKANTNIYENESTSIEFEYNYIKGTYPNNIIVFFNTIFIGEETFSNCANLTTVRLSKSINDIYYNAFEKCENLKDVYIDNLKSNMITTLPETEGVRVHYSDCVHTVTLEPIEETKLIEEEATKEGEAYACESSYTFKTEGRAFPSINGEVVRPDERGLYTIERLTEDTVIKTVAGQLVSIKYVDTEGKELKQEKILVGQTGESYKTGRIEIENYRAYGEEPINAEGTFTEEEIIVTYVYERIPSGKVTVKYVDETGENILEPETVQGYVGEEYEIKRKNIKGYVESGAEPEYRKGIYTEEDREVIFIYEKIKEETVVVKYVNEEDRIIKPSKVIKDVKGDEYETEPGEIEGYKRIDKQEEGKEITYTYEKTDKTGKENKWTTEKTLMTIAGLIAILIVIFIIIAKREKEVEVNGKKYNKIEDAIEDIDETQEKVEIKLLKDIEREEKIEGLNDETIKIDYNGYEIKIHEQENKSE